MRRSVNSRFGDTKTLRPCTIPFAGGIFGVREAFFRSRPGPQILLTLIFCVFSHLLWVTLQYLRSGGQFGGFGRVALQAVGRSLFTALLMPIGYRLLNRIRNWLIAPAAPRSRR